MHYFVDFERESDRRNPIEYRNMEDVVIDAEGSVLPLILSPRSGNEKEDDGAEDDKKADKAEGVDRKVSGSRNHLFPRLIFGREAEDEKEEKEEGKEQRGTVDEGTEEGKGGGIITHLISHIVSPPTPQVGEVIEVENWDSKSEEDVGVGGHGRGVINNLISNLFHQSNGGEQSEEAEKVIAVEGSKKPKKEDEGEDGGGGIIDSIVSHLPTSLPDDAAPTTDEASILIHSIVRD